MELRLEDVVVEGADRADGNAAVAVGGARHSHTDLDRKSTLLAAALTDRGVKKGDRVGVFMDDRYETVISILAVLKAGGALVPVDPATPAARLAVVLDEGRVAALITEVRHAATAATALAESAWVKLVVLAGGLSGTASHTCLRFEDVVAGIARPPPGEAGTDDDPVLIVCRSARRASVPITMTRGETAAAAAALVLDGGGVRVRQLWQPTAVHRLLAALASGATVVLEARPGASAKRVPAAAIGFRDRRGLSVSRRREEAYAPRR